MGLFFNIILLIFCLTAVKTSIYTSVKDDLLSLLKSYAEPKRNIGTGKFGKGKNVIPKSNGLKSNGIKNENVYKSMGSIRKKNAHINPLMDLVKRRQIRTSSSSSESSSSSREFKEWKDEWREQWAKKKYQAINSTNIQGDVINMVAARPWGVPCGDPNQHDMPWGTCTLPMECDGEYRIYRGDFLCGRTQFVCCALQLTTYDTYQGFDVSFADSSLSTDSEEKRDEGKSKEKKKKKNSRNKKKRKKARDKRKKRIKKDIRKITKEIKKILNRLYKNGTSARKKKTKQLKKFVKHLKKQYKKDRKSIKQIHELEIIKIDEALKQRLEEIRLLNDNFYKNDTFRAIIVNGTMTKKDARMLVKAYPDLSVYFKDKLRRSGDLDLPKDYLEYDVEYGLLYS